MQNAVLHFETREPRAHRLLVEHPDVQPAARNQALIAPRQHPGIRTIGDQYRRDSRLVVHFNQKRTPALFHEIGFCRTFLDLHATFGIYFDADQTMAIENLLDLVHGSVRVTSCARELSQLRCLFGRQGIAEKFECVQQTRHLCRERLMLHARDHRQLLC